MRAAVERFARRWWAGELGGAGRLLDVVTAPASGLWSAVTAVRNARYDRARGASVPGLAVVSVGNLAVGGTGKTPVASWVAGVLQRGGRSPALLLSDYGRDERLLHGRWRPDVPVVSARDRVEAARRARLKGADVAVVDDGFQHRRLGRAVDLVLIAAEDAFPGRRLPRGPYREGPSALRRASAVVVTRRTATRAAARQTADRLARVAASAVRAAVHLAPGGWSDLEGSAAGAPEGDVLAVAAIARPGAFEATVRELVDGRVELVALADHHEYTRPEVEALARRSAGRTIVVTEKDAVKLVAFRDTLRRVAVLGQELRWEWGEDDLVALLLDGVGAADA